MAVCKTRDSQAEKRKEIRGNGKDKPLDDIIS